MIQKLLACNSVETTDTDMILFEESQHSIYTVYSIALFQSGFVQ